MPPKTNILNAKTEGLGRCFAFFGFHANFSGVYTMTNAWMTKSRQWSMVTWWSMLVVDLFFFLGPLHEDKGTIRWNKGLELGLKEKHSLKVAASLLTDNSSSWRPCPIWFFFGGHLKETHTLEVQDQTKWLVFRMIRVKDSLPTNGKSVVFGLRGAKEPPLQKAQFSFFPWENRTFFFQPDNFKTGLIHGARSAFGTIGLYLWVRTLPRQKQKILCLWFPVRNLFSYPWGEAADRNPGAWTGNGDPWWTLLAPWSFTKMGESVIFYGFYTPVI